MDFIVSIVSIDYLGPGGIRGSIYLGSQGVVACLPYSGWYPCVVYVHVNVRACVCVYVRACRKGAHFGCVSLGVRLSFTQVISYIRPD